MERIPIRFEVSLIKNTNLKQLEEENNNQPQAFDKIRMLLVDDDFGKMGWCLNHYERKVNPYTQMGDWLVGQNGLKKLQEQLQDIKRNMWQLYSHYKQVVAMLNGTMESFLNYRQDVLAVYSYYTRFLLAIFGDYFGYSWGRSVFGYIGNVQARQ